MQNYYNLLLLVSWLVSSNIWTADNSLSNKKKKQKESTLIQWGGPKTLFRSLKQLKADLWLSVGVRLLSA